MCGAMQYFMWKILFLPVKIYTRRDVASCLAFTQVYMTHVILHDSRLSLETSLSQSWYDPQEWLLTGQATNIVTLVSAYIVSSYAILLVTMYFAGTQGWYAKQQLMADMHPSTEELCQATLVSTLHSHHILYCHKISIT